MAKRPANRSDVPALLAPRSNPIASVHSRHRLAPAAATEAPSRCNSRSAITSETHQVA